VAHGMKPRVVAVIPARGGSKGLPGKNVRALAGRPLIAWSVEAAKRCPLIDRTIVSTDNQAIAAAACDAGAEVPFMRPAEHATDTATTEAVLQHAIEWLEREERYTTDIVVFLQPTDVFRRQEWVRQVVQHLIDDPELESSFVGYVTYKNYWQRTASGYTPVSHRGYGPRQHKATVLREDTGLACATRAALIRHGRRIGDRVRIVENDDFCTGIDIHDEFDLWLAEAVIARGTRRPND
jgi:CMP-N,N'-diacetyllegionaminic acid synthase